MAYQGIDRLVAHFLAVADEGGVTKAAVELNISQPALSRSIRMLEDRIGVPLFHRRSSGVELTAYGRLLARRARAMQLEYEHALTEIDALLHGREGIIRIGAIPAWETIYIPQALTAARDKLEGINFTVVGGATRPLLAQLREGAIDLACIALEELPPPDIATEVLMDMERVVVSSAAHPLAQRKTVTAEDLLKYPWSQLKGDEITPSRLGGYFSAYGLEPPNIELECESNSSLISIMRTSEIISTAPKPFAEHRRSEGLTILPIQGSLWHYKTGIAYRRETSPPAFLMSFISHLRSSLSDDAKTTSP